MFNGLITIAGGRHRMSYFVLAEVGLLASALMLGMGCSSTAATQGTDALNQVSKAFCARASTCCTTVDQAMCQSEVSTAYKSVGFDTGKDYTSDSVNKCTGEINALACPTGACLFTVPADCPGPGALLPIGASGDAGTGTD